MEFTLLGTSAMVPTKERNVSGIYLDYKGEGILFDCGEGSQRQMNIAGINRNKISRIFISHWHGDHVAGLLGLIQTMSNGKEQVSLSIYGPLETKKRLFAMLSSVYFDNTIDIKVYEYDPKGIEVCCTTDDYYVTCMALDHNIPCLAYSFIEKDRRRITVDKVKQLGIPDGPLLGKLQQGMSITYNGTTYTADDLTYIVPGKKASIIMDTGFSNDLFSFASNAEVLICEATYLEAHAEKGDAHKHLTVSHAAMIAHNACVKRLILTHFSQRYKDVQDIIDEANQYFKDVSVGHDFMRIKV